MINEQNVNDRGVYLNVYFNNWFSIQGSYSDLGQE